MSNKGTHDRTPSGIMLRYRLQGHRNTINRIAWSRDGKMLASPSRDQTIRLWDAQTGQHLHTLTGHSDSVNSVTWSPDDRVLASGSTDQTVRLWNVQTGQHLYTLTGHSWAVYSVAWSPDGSMLASASEDQTVRLWNAQTGQLLRTFIEHIGAIISVTWSPDGSVLASSGSEDQTVRLWDARTGKSLHTFTGYSYDVYSVAWSPNGRILASDSTYNTIHLWNPSTGRRTRILEGHTSSIRCISFSSDGRLLASKSGDGTVRIWRTDTWETVAMLEEPASSYMFTGLAFHPKAPVLATLGEYDEVLRIWDLDVTTLLGIAPSDHQIHYTNAKVVLVGDSGVGKSGLGLVLAGQPFVPTESTHGRRVWTFDSREVEDAGHKETRETMLWDLAGQPGYRLIHQLHLSEVVVALVVFDSRSETDPFAGVYHWARALRLAERVQGNTSLRVKKLLVAARIDRGGKNVSRERINSLMHELGFDGYFETSAKEGRNIALLAEAIKNAIDWDTQLKVTSTDLFQSIKVFLVSEKEAGRLLSTFDDLYRTFLKSERNTSEIENLYAQFETCIGRVEAQGLIRRLSFGNLVLLQPELLDAYASALVNAVRDEPDGLGSITEEKVRAGDFAMPKDERISNSEHEKLLLIAVIEDLLRYEIALREQGDDGAYLVFPSQTTRENPDLPDPEGKAVIFGFEGPIQTIYATLAVRLSHSSLFTKKELWKNAVTYTTEMGGTYGISLYNIGEGRGELTLFFDKATSEEKRFHFEEYVRIHLQRRALSETIHRRRIFVCPTCGEPFTDAQTTKRRSLGFKWIRCSVCDTTVSLLDREERFAAVPISRIAEMDRAADSRVERETAKSTVQGKIETKDFDVFLCHNNKDKAEILRIGEQLKECGILPWLDDWELHSGLPWQHLLEKQMEQIKSAAAFVGRDGLGPWVNMELEGFLRQFMKRNCPIILVLLPSAPKEPQLPTFLKGMTWVDFRKRDPDPMEQFVSSITRRRG